MNSNRAFYATNGKRALYLAMKISLLLAHMAGWGGGEIIPIYLVIQIYLSLLHIT